MKCEGHDSKHTPICEAIFALNGERYCKSQEEADPVIIIHGLLDALKWVAQWKDFYQDPIKKIAFQKHCNPAIEAGKAYIRGLNTQ